jgi:hypothetical protein
MKNLLICSTLLSILFFSCGKDDETPSPGENNTQTNTTSNNSPAAKDDVSTLTEGESVTIDVMANDTDADKDALQISSAKVLSGKGSVSVNPDKKSLKFTTVAGDAGTTVIEYSVSDSKGGSATGKVTVTVKTKPVTYENFIKFNDASYIPNGGGWVQAGIFGYDYMRITQEINRDYFYSRYVEIKISSMFDYYEAGKTFTFTTTSATSDIPKGQAHVQFRDETQGPFKAVVYDAEEGQTIKLTVTKTHATGIYGYMQIDNITVTGGNKLSVRSNR